MKPKRPTPIFADNDPRSSRYMRKLVTPKLAWGRIAVRCLLPLAVLIILWVLLPVAALPVCLGATVIYGLWNLKTTLITMVQLYQVLAPRKLRMKCRFEPSCSQYMVLSLQKYGAFRGLWKGIRRLSRCNDRGDGLKGGFDEP